MYTLEQIRKAGTEGEICSIDVDHLITVLIELYGSGISQNDGKPIVSRSKCDYHAAFTFCGDNGITYCSNCGDPV